MLPVAESRENRELLFNWYRVSLWDDEKFSKGIVVMVAQHCRSA